jgi:hypothetical protein
MKKLVVMIAIFSLVDGILPAERPKDIQQLVLDETPTAFYAALPIYASVQGGRVATAVIGTGFVVNGQGDFITAGHVASTRAVGTGANRVNVRLTVGLRQKKVGISGASFNVVEIDSDHDLALCHVEGLRGVSFAESGVQKIAHREQPGGLTADEISQPFASLAIDQGEPQAGRFILVSGFPSRIPPVDQALGSLNQFSVLSCPPEHSPFGPSRPAGWEKTDTDPGGS